MPEGGACGECAKGLAWTSRGGRGLLASVRPLTRCFDDGVQQRQPIFRSVGISYVEGTVRGPAGVEARVRFLIDSGATYSLLPEGVWRAIGLAPKRQVDFVLADGTTVRRSVSECHLSLIQGEGHTPVVLGQPGDVEALLGVVTLEILGLVFDPFRRTLQPMRALLV